jgi:hypothetical protein
VSIILAFARLRPCLRNKKEGREGEEGRGREIEGEKKRGRGGGRELGRGGEKEEKEKSMFAKGFSELCWKDT